MLLTIIWGAGSTLATLGATMMALTFSDLLNRYFVVGVAALIVGAMMCCTGLMCQRSRTLDEEYDAGFRMGYRAGRKVPLTSTVSPIRRVRGGLNDFNKAVIGGRRGRIPKAPVGPAPGHGEAPRREANHTHGPA